MVDRLLLKPTEAAQALGIGRSKIYELIMSGVIESVLIGTARRVPAEALASYVRDLRQRAVS
jgi:excisionase family DNA binding protein